MSATAQGARRVALDVLNPVYFTIIVTASACVWYLAAVFKAGRHPKGFCMRGMAATPIAYAVYDLLSVHHNHSRETSVAWAYGVILLVIAPSAPCAVALLACKCAPMGAVPLMVLQAWPVGLMASSLAYVFTGGGVDSWVPFAIPVVLVGAFVMVAHSVHGGKRPRMALLLLVWMVESATLALFAVTGLRTIFQGEEAVPETISRHADAAGVVAIVVVLSVARILYMTWAEGRLISDEPPPEEGPVTSRGASLYTGAGTSGQPPTETSALLWE